MDPMTPARLHKILVTLCTALQHSKPVVIAYATEVRTSPHTGQWETFRNGWFAIEPYSLTRAEDGGIIVSAVECDSHTLRDYRADRILRCDLPDDNSNQTPTATPDQPQAEQQPTDTETARDHTTPHAAALTTQPPITAEPSRPDTGGTDALKHWPKRVHALIPGFWENIGASYGLIDVETEHGVSGISGLVEGPTTFEEMTNATVIALQQRLTRDPSRNEHFDASAAGDLTCSIRFAPRPAPATALYGIAGDPATNREVEKGTVIAVVTIRDTPEYINPAEYSPRARCAADRHTTVTPRQQLKAIQDAWDEVLKKNAD